MQHHCKYSVHTRHQPPILHTTPYHFTPHSLSPPSPTISPSFPQDKTSYLDLIKDPTAGTPEDKLRLFAIYYILAQDMLDVSVCVRVCACACACMDVLVCGCVCLCGVWMYMNVLVGGRGGGKVHW